jgi:hypothetical protein
MPDKLTRKISLADSTIDTLSDVLLYNKDIIPAVGLEYQHYSFIDRASKTYTDKLCTIQFHSSNTSEEGDEEYARQIKLHNIDIAKHYVSYIYFLFRGFPLIAFNRFREILLSKEVDKRVKFVVANAILEWSLVDEVSRGNLLLEFYETIVDLTGEVGLVRPTPHTINPCTLVCSNCGDDCTTIKYIGRNFCKIEAKNDTKNA